ncbi:hypothetical protein BG011_000804, partial [Mortierella polycephala]
MAEMLTLFCLVEGGTVPFSTDISPTRTIDHLKKLIKTEKAVEFSDVDADQLTLWHVSIPVDLVKKNDVILFDAIDTKQELMPTDDLSDVFVEKPPKKTIHIIVQRPSLGVLSADVKEITDKFFESGSPVAVFLKSYVSGEGALPVTAGNIRGLPRAWRRSLGKPVEARPSLLFLDLPDPSTTDTSSRNLASASILDMVKENNRPLIPVFGVSGCGKTRAVIELLCQHWGFYFNATSDDWGSDDVIMLHSYVGKHLTETRTPDTVDRQANNAYARKTTYLLFLSRLLILKYCLSVPDSSKTFTSARWTLLQVCPHVLFKDFFSTLFEMLFKLRCHGERDLMEFVNEVLNETRVSLVHHGCMPKLEDDTRLLVVLDEAQFLGDEFNGSFQSMSSSDESPRPLLSPILHGLRDIGRHQLTV